MAERLQAARIAAGFKTQTAIAEFLSISQQRYGGWERGEWLPNELLLIRALCDALDITADYLLFGRTAGMSRTTYDKLFGRKP